MKGSADGFLAGVTPAILTYNEAANIERTLERLTWARRVVIVDSFSEDDTVERARRFPNVEVFERRFDTFAGQWTFAKDETRIDTPWVLALDADYLVTDDLQDEMRALPTDGEAAGYRTSFVYCVYGRPLRGSIYPPVTTLYRRDRASYTMDGHTQRVAVDGPVGELRGRLLHDDRKPLTTWLWAQDRYARAEAEKLATTPASELGLNDRIRKLKVVAPAVTPFYCLLLRGGLLDGTAGWFYAAQRTIAELVLSLHLLIPQVRRPPDDPQVRRPPDD